MTLKLGTLEADLTLDTSGLETAQHEWKRTLTHYSTDVASATKKANKAWFDASKHYSEHMRETAAETGRAMKKSEQQQKRFTAGFKPMRGAVQQTAFQIQDFAVQVGNGTNAMVSFSQQAPQLLSVFGAGGAIAGAIVGVGAALAGTLLPALFDTGDAMDDLEEATESLDEVLTRAARDGGVVLLTEKIVKLADESRNAALTMLRAGMVDALDAIDASAKVATETLDAFFSNSFLDSGSSPVLGELTALAQELGVTQEQLASLRAAARNVMDDSSQENLEAFQKVLEDITGPAQGNNSELAVLARDMRVSLEASRDATESLQTLENAYTDLDKAVEDATMTLDDSIKTDVNKIRNAKLLAKWKREQREQEALARKEAREAAKEAARLQREEEARLKGNTDISRLNESDLEQINREASERRQFILEQEQLTADEQSALLATIREKQISDTNAHNDAILESERRLQERRASQEEAATQRLATLRAAQQSAALQGLNALGNAANDILAATGQEGTAIAKAIFLAQKAIQVAQILAATEVAAANAAAVAALGGPVGFFATQGAIRAAGYASAALVAGLAVGETFGGGRRFGGAVSPQMAHPINEAGVPEILNMAGKQYLLPTGKGGTVSPLDGGGGSGGAPKVTVINQGTPQNMRVESYSESEIRLIAQDVAKGTERRINASLATGRGDTAASLRKGYRVSRNLV